MLTAPAYYKATAVAQVLLARHGAEALQPDGKWGRFTQSAYDQAPQVVRKEVDSMLKSLTPPTSADELRNFRDAQRPKGQLPPVDARQRASVVEAIRQIALDEGVPFETARKIAWLESKFDQSAVSPTGAIGVYQLTSIAVKDIAQRGKYRVSDPRDLMQNLRGGIKYIKIVARDLGVRLDQTAEVYMGFNIGPTGARYVLAGHPEMAAKQIRLQAYGKQGVAQYAQNLRGAVVAA